MLGFGMWRPKKLGMKRAMPPSAKAIKCRRTRDLDDEGDWFMDKVQPTIDPTPRPIASILRDRAPAARPLDVKSMAVDSLTVLADAEVASLTPPLADTRDAAPHEGPRPLGVASYGA